VAPVRIYVSGERVTSIIRVTRSGFHRSVLRLLVTANVVPISPFLVTMMMETIRYFEMSVLMRVKGLNIIEDDILHSHCLENLKSCIAFTGWAL
jgi:hypothetical protein